MIKSSLAAFLILLSSYNLNTDAVSNSVETPINKDIPFSTTDSDELAILDVLMSNEWEFVSSKWQGIYKRQTWESTQEYDWDNSCVIINSYGVSTYTTSICYRQSISFTEDSRMIENYERVFNSYHASKRYVYKYTQVDENTLKLKLLPKESESIDKNYSKLQADGYEAVFEIDGDNLIITTIVDDDEYLNGSLYSYHNQIAKWDKKIFTSYYKRVQNDIEASK